VLGIGFGDVTGGGRFLLTSVGASVFISVYIQQKMKNRI